MLPGFITRTDLLSLVIEEALGKRIKHNIFSHFPEHSVAGFTDSWLSGTDFVELDIHMSKDGYLIINHD